MRNSTLLVDFINLQISNGMDPQHTVIWAASVCARSIALTGLAAMLGMFILDDPIFNGPAISLLFGILVCTAWTLAVIQVLYYAILCKKFQ